MREFFPILETCPLFNGLSQADLTSVLACVGARTAFYSKGESVFLAGAPVRDVGIVLTGAVHILREDYDGNRTILGPAGPGQLFAEAFACAGAQTLPVSVVAAETSSILLMDCRRLTTGCANACPFHGQLIRNLLQVMAEKNLAFSQKLEVLSRRTTREKLLAYLGQQSQLRGSRRFTIPFDRQELADYLGVERSAMSAELSRLQKEGVLRTERSRFTLL